jgi:hypothetical protein
LKDKIKKLEQNTLHRERISGWKSSEMKLRIRTHPNMRCCFDPRPGYSKFFWVRGSRLVSWQCGPKRQVVPCAFSVPGVLCSCSGSFAHAVGLVPLVRLKGQTHRDCRECSK